MVIMSYIRFRNMKDMVKSYFKVITQHSEKTEEINQFFAQDSYLSSKI